MHISAAGGLCGQLDVRASVCVTPLGGEREKETVPEPGFVWTWVHDLLHAVAVIVLKLAQKCLHCNVDD